MWKNTEKSSEKCTEKWCEKTANFSPLKPDKKLCKTDNYAKIFNPKKNGFFGAKTPKNSGNCGLPKSLIDTVHPKLD